ncbi:hypothetical protein AGMMS49965_24190 [Bacteroidia bacterium]|nr:hypothetical protein AGMMS49965_24190 [Bacteroidia bacterium]
MKRYVIAGFPGVGKTTLANKYPNLFADVKFGKNYIGKTETECDTNFISNIKAALKDGKIPLSSGNVEAIKSYVNAKLTVLLVYPLEGSRKEYFKRYLNRPDEKQWVRYNILSFDSKVEIINNMNFKNIFKVVLSEKQTLEDFVSTFINLKKQ